MFQVVLNLAWVTLPMWQKAAKMLPRNKARKVRIEHDNGVFEGPASMIFVALTNSIAGFESVAPDAKLDDGNFTLIIVKLLSSLTCCP